MHIKFNENYIDLSNRSIAMVVANTVQGDSRVIKTAATLSKFGFRVHLYGMSRTDHDETLTGYPFNVELVANPGYKMKAERQWLDDQGNQDIPLFIERLAQNIATHMGGLNFDALHTHDMLGLPVGAALKEFLQASVVWVHDVHEFTKGCTHIPERKRVLMVEFEQKYIRKPDALITVSPILAKLLAENYGLDEPILVLNTPRLSDFDPWHPYSIRRALGLDASVPLIVYNGNVKPERGVHFAVEALGLLPKVHLALVTNSQGPYLVDLQKIAAQCHASDRLHLHPYVPNCEVTSFLRDVNAGVNPLTLYGNSDLCLPTKLFEYIHAGVPVVSTSLTAMSSFLDTNPCGVAFPEGNVQAMVNGIEQVFALYPEGLPNVAQGSMIAAKYCWEVQEVVIEDLYKRLLNANVLRPEKKGKRQVKPIMHLSPEPIINSPASNNVNQPFIMTKEFKESGYSALCASLNANEFGFGYDSEIKNNAVKSIKSYLVKQELSNYQTYHYHVRPLIYRGDFSFPTGIDLVLLKAMGKSVFFHFRGSEARLNSIFKESTPYHYVDEQADQDYEKMSFSFDENRQVAFRDFVCGVCDDVFVNDPELQCYVPNALIVPRAIDIDNYSTKQQTLKGSIPLVVHAPSRRGVKGTHYVLKAVNILKKEGYQFDFKLVEHMPHQEAMEIYRDATIIVDQLRIGWYGVLAVEGMSLGKAVVCYIRNDLRHYLPIPAPLAIANPDNISDVLRYLLENPAAVVQYGEAGKKFTQEYHDAQRIAKLLVDIYSRPFRPIDPVTASEYILGFQPESKLIKQAKAFLISGEPESAEILLKQVLNQNFRNLDALTQLAEIATAHKDWDEAIKRWERVLSVSQSAGIPLPKQTLTRLEKARIAQAVAFRKSGEFNSAEALLQQVMNQNPEDIGVYTQLAEVATACKDWDEAIKRWERVLSVSQSAGVPPPKQALLRIEKVRMAQAVAFRKSGELNSAEALLQQVLNQNHDDIGVYTQLAEVATARKDWDEAIKRWERVLSVSKAAGMPLPKQALTRLENARMAQRGLLGTLSYSIHQFFSFGREK